MPDARTITVSGTGQVSATPDQATIRLGVQLVRPTAQAARHDAAVAARSIIEAVRGAGIGERDVRTEMLSLTPAWEYPPNAPPRRTGYQAVNRLAVLARDLEALGRVVDAAIAAGATTLDGLEFGFADASRLQLEALGAAVGEARAKAEALASAAGAVLGAAASIEESVPPRPGPMFAAKVELAADTPIEPGQTEVAATVRMVFSLE